MTIVHRPSGSNIPVEFDNRKAYERFTEKYEASQYVNHFLAIGAGDTGRYHAVVSCHSESDRNRFLDLLEKNGATLNFTRDPS